MNKKYIHLIFMAMAFIALGCHHQRQHCLGLDHGDNDDIEIIRQFRLDAERALSEEYDVVLVRRTARRIYSQEDMPLHLCMTTDYEVIISVKDEFICGSVIREMSLSDMPYRESIEYNVSPQESHEVKVLFALSNDMICKQESLCDEFQDGQVFSRKCFYTDDYLLPITPPIDSNSVCFKHLLAEFDRLREKYNATVAH